MTDEIFNDEPKNPNIGGRLVSVMEQALKERGIDPNAPTPVQNNGPKQAQFVDNISGGAPPAWDSAGVSNELTQEMADVVRPLAPEEFDIGPRSNFVRNLPTHIDSDLDGEARQIEFGAEGWNTKLEQDVRGWMSKAELSHTEAARMQYAFTHAARKGFTQETEESNRQATMSQLVHKYGIKAGDAIKAAQRVIAQAGGDELKQFLNETGLGSHPGVVNTFVEKAKQKGWFKA